MSNAVQRVSYDDKETRTDEMHRTIEQWLDDLRDLTDEARATEQFQAWLDTQDRFHDYSFRNTLLIKQQCPHATKVAGDRTWQEEFDRQVDGGESAIWFWAPMIADQCPDCGNSPNYSDHDGCETLCHPTSGRSVSSDSVRSQSPIVASSLRTNRSTVAQVTDFDDDERDRSRVGAALTARRHDRGLSKGIGTRGTAKATG